MSAEDAIQAGLPEVEPAPRRMPLRWPRGATWITWVCATTCLSVGADLMQMFAELDKARAVAAIRAGGAGVERFMQAHRLSTLLAFILIVLFFPSTAIALRWMYITYRNLFGLQVEGLTYTPVDAIKKCFIPTSWLYLPYRILQEIWLASNPALPSGSSEWKTQSGSWLIRLWWLTFLGRFLRISISITPFPNDPTLLKVMEVAAWCTVASAALGAVAGVLLIVIVLRIERRQWQRYDRLQW
jgi:hypothetical protein